MFHSGLKSALCVSSLAMWSRNLTLIQTTSLGLSKNKVGSPQDSIASSSSIGGMLEPQQPSVHKSLVRYFKGQFDK